jgi:hypothetical protein
VYPGPPNPSTKSCQLHKVCGEAFRNVRGGSKSGVVSWWQAVIQWFADRADMIIIMFDAHKLDISDELRVVMDSLRIHQDKIRILLNKADTIDSQSLMRVYGALMWSLGKVVNTPEVCRVYIGSFWDENRHLIMHSENR